MASFTYRVTKNDWQHELGGWLCPVLAVPGAKVKAMHASSKRLSDDDFIVDGEIQIVRWRDGEASAPDDAVLTIELTKELITPARAAMLAAIATIVAAVITAGGAYISATIQKNSPTVTASVAKPPPGQEAAPKTYEVSLVFGAASNGGRWPETYRNCFGVSRSAYHFTNWKITKSIFGDGDAWFDPAPAEGSFPKTLCVHADASVTTSGKNSAVNAVLSAVEVPD